MTIKNDKYQASMLCRILFCDIHTDCECQVWIYHFIFRHLKSKWANHIVWSVVTSHHNMPSILNISMWSSKLIIVCMYTVQCWRQQLETKTVKWKKIWIEVNKQIYHCYNLSCKLDSLIKQRVKPSTFKRK